MTFSFPSYPRMRVTFRPSRHAQSSSGILFPLTSYPTPIGHPFPPHVMPDPDRASRIKIPYFGGASRGGKAVFISLDPRFRKDDAHLFNMQDLFKKADLIIDTSGTFKNLQQQVFSILSDLIEKPQKLKLSNINMFYKEGGY